jgi:hypothetical protein
MKTDAEILEELRDIILPPAEDGRNCFSETAMANMFLEAQEVLYPDIAAKARRARKEAGIAER